ncbi:MAG: DivIVA domain-containing protein [Cellulomonadaceae bacterium]|jgi:DivIVA domain-containing protein|nr:DivIVA domain-containing protein [Cellulomonadaceae bacterium]
MAPKGKHGYDVDEVDAFFADARQAYEGQSATEMGVDHIHTATFDLVKRGYDITEVDAALDRLESAFIARDRAAFINTHGPDAWMTQLADRARTLYPRLSRPAGERFARPGLLNAGYATADVDALCQRMVAYFDRQQPLTSHEIRTATFGHARGAKAYNEAPVDAFMSRAVEVLLGVE